MLYSHRYVAGGRNWNWFIFSCCLLPDSFDSKTHSLWQTEFIEVWTLAFASVEKKNPKQPRLSFIEFAMEI